MKKNTRLLAVSAFFSGLAFLLPNHYPQWRSFYLEYTAFVALWVLLVHASYASYPNALKVPRLLAALCAIASIPLVQAWTGVIYFSGDGWMAALYLMALAVAYGSSYALSESDRPFFAQGIAWVFLLSSVISALIALSQWTGIAGHGIWIVDLDAGGRAGANVGQANHLATLLCLGIASTLYLHERQRLSAFPSWIIAVLLILAIGTTASRTPILGASFLLFWWAFKKPSLSRTPAKAILLGLGIYASLVVLWSLFRPDLWVAEIPDIHSFDSRTRLGARTVIWAQLLDAAFRAPWYGYGWGQVTVAQLGAVADYPLTQWTEHSHNILLDLVIWNGLPIGLLIIAGLGYWGLTRAIRSSTPESWFCLLAIGLMMIHGLLEYPLEYGYFLLPLGFLAGITDADQKKTPAFTMHRFFVWSALIVSTVLMVLIWQEYRTVEEDYRLMRFETSRIGSLKADQPAPDVILLTQLREDLRYARTEARANMTPNELEWMRQVTYRYPYFASLFRYSLALALNNRRPEATLEMLHIDKLYGGKPYMHAISAMDELAKSQHPELQSWVANLALPTEQRSAGEK